MKRPSGLLRELAVIGVAVLILTALGPFGSYSMPLVRRLGQWGLYLFGGYLFFAPVLAAGRALAEQSGLPRAVAVAAACLLSALPTSLIVALVAAGYRWRDVTLASLASLYPQVVIVGATVTIIQALVRRPSRPPAGEGAEAVPPPTMLPDAAELHEETQPAPAEGKRPAAPLLDLLPPALGRDVICLENEDHYVRAHTPLGSTLLLMRMRDAVTQLEGVDGERVHRGWWVARHAVVAVVRDGRNHRLRLADGREVPVARSSVPALREGGWFDLPA